MLHLCFHSLVSMALDFNVRGKDNAIAPLVRMKFVTQKRDECYRMLKTQLPKVFLLYGKELGSQVRVIFSGGLSGWGSPVSGKSEH